MNTLTLAFRTREDARRFAETVRGRQEVRSDTLELVCAEGYVLTATIKKQRGRARQAVRAAGYNYTVIIGCRQASV